MGLLIMANVIWSMQKELLQNAAWFITIWAFRLFMQYTAIRKKKLHIHFCVNTIIFYTGMKWHSSHKDLHEREMIFNMILNRYMNLIIPIQFINTNINEVCV